MIFGKYFYYFSDNMVLFSTLFPLFIFSKFTHKSDSVENTEKCHCGKAVGGRQAKPQLFHSYQQYTLTEHILALLSAHLQAYRWLQLPLIEYF